MQDVVEQEVVEEETVEDTEQEVEPDRDESDPQKALAEVLDQRAKLAEVEAEARELHHKLARTQVRILFKLLDDFAGLFADGAVQGAYEEISDCLRSINHHDPDVGKNLASNVYADVVGDHEFFSWWLNLLQGYLIPGQPLGRVLQQVFSKPSGSPFAD